MCVCKCFEKKRVVCCSLERPFFVFAQIILYDNVLTLLLFYLKAQFFSFSRSAEVFTRHWGRSQHLTCTGTLTGFQCYECNARLVNLTT